MEVKNTVMRRLVRRFGESTNNRFIHEIRGKNDPDDPGQAQLPDKYGTTVLVQPRA